MRSLDVKALQPRGRWRAGRFFPPDWTTVEVDEATAKALHGDPLLSIRESGTAEAPLKSEAELAAAKAELEKARAAIAELVSEYEARGNDLVAALERIEALEAELAAAKAELEKAAAELESKKKR
jgi:hypothetical protein